MALVLSGGADELAPAAEAAGATVIVEQLEKRYPKSPVNAVDKVSFSVARGEIFGLLGPNGAGKTTTIGVLTTRVRPTGGRALVGGVDVVADPVAARRKLAVVPQRNNLDRSLSIRQNLLFHARYHGVPAAEREAQAERLLTQFALIERADQKVDFFSGGQMQRVMIARAMMHSPEVLFLDEPATGLDPAARLFVWDRITELRDAGVTVVLTTHDMDEAATLADRVGIMDHGRLLALDSPEALTRALPGSSTLELAVSGIPTASAGGSPADRSPLAAALGTLEGVERAEDVTDGGEERVRLYLTADAASMVAPVARLVAERGGQLTDLRLGTPSLEDVFISLTGRALR